jgi:hypothetical protein
VRFGRWEPLFSFPLPRDCATTTLLRHFLNASKDLEHLRDCSSNLSCKGLARRLSGISPARPGFLAGRAPHVHDSVPRPRLLIVGGHGRVVQRENVPFTRGRSEVRSLSRPPSYVSLGKIISVNPKLTGSNSSLGTSQEGLTCDSSPRLHWRCFAPPLSPPVQLRRAASCLTRGCGAVLPSKAAPAAMPTPPADQHQSQRERRWRRLGLLGHRPTGGLQRRTGASVPLYHIEGRQH